MHGACYIFRAIHSHTATNILNQNCSTRRSLHQDSLAGIVFVLQTKHFCKRSFANAVLRQLYQFFELK